MKNFLSPLKKIASTIFLYIPSTRYRTVSQLDLVLVSGGYSASFSAIAAKLKMRE